MLYVEQQRVHPSMLFFNKVCISSAKIKMQQNIKCVNILLVFDWIKKLIEKRSFMAKSEQLKKWIEKVMSCRTLNEVFSSHCDQIKRTDKVTGTEELID